MGYLIAVEDGRGTMLETLIERRPILTPALIGEDQTIFPVLWQIDWEGDTTFNHLQIPALRKELKRLCEGVVSSEDLAFLAQLDGLAERAAGNHLYLKFYGD